MRTPTFLLLLTCASLVLGAWASGKPGRKLLGVGPDGPPNPKGPPDMGGQGGSMGGPGGPGGPGRPGGPYPKHRPVIIPSANVITPSTIPGCAGAVAENCCYAGKDRGNCWVDGVELYFPNEYSTNDNLFWVDPASGDICACP